MSIVCRGANFERLPDGALFADGRRPCKAAMGRYRMASAVGMDESDPLIEGGLLADPTLLGGMVPYV